MITVLSLSPAIDKIYFVENFEAGQHYRTNNILKSAGGKGLNVARVLSILGEGVTTLGFKAGQPGDWLASEIAELGINTRLISVQGESRTNSNIIDPVRGTETELLEIGPYITDNNLKDFMMEFEQELNNTEILVCSGGLPEGVSSNFYKLLLEKAKTLSIKTILDSSNETLVEGIKGKPNIIKPNLRELSKYAGRILKDTSEIVEACRNILQEGVEIVVTSLGSEGAILVSKQMVVQAKIRPINIINSIGSGDSMVAGFAFGISNNYPIEKMLKFGMACAVANTQFAEIGMVSRELVQKYMNEIEIITS